MQNREMKGRSMNILATALSIQVFLFFETVLVFSVLIG